MHSVMRIPMFPRRVKSLLVLFAAVALQAAMPVLVYAHLAHEGALTQVTCAVPVMRDTTGDAEGGAPEEHAGHEHGERDEHGDHCGLCATAGATPVSTLIQIHQRQAPVAVVPDGQMGTSFGRAVSTPPATGPPSRS